MNNPTQSPTVSALRRALAQHISYTTPAKVPAHESNLARSIRERRLRAVDYTWSVGTAI